jgi:hypothetical protein
MGRYRMLQVKSSLGYPRAGPKRVNPAQAATWRGLPVGNQINRKITCCQATARTEGLPVKEDT